LESVRVIPVLLLDGTRLVKTVGFRDARYVGDPRNAVKIFNEKEVDELLLLDITATVRGAPPQFDLIREIVSEAFMPIGYGGGIRSIEDAERVLQLGVEKVALCTAAVRQPELVSALATRVGSQSVVVVIDVKRSLLGRRQVMIERRQVMIEGGRTGTGREPVAFAREVERLGAGEIVINSVDRDGTMKGYDIALVRDVSAAVSVPLVACGGAGSLSHLVDAVRDGGASGVAAGSMFVFHGPHRAVLIQYPARAALDAAFAAMQRS
jgi:imidazole glycerol-phosphate synthase subunit HisF